MNEQAAQPWGAYSIQFKLPATRVQLTGLSLIQLASLEENYQGFITETTKNTDEISIECRAYRLDHPPTVSSRALTLDGQYAPRKIRWQNKKGFELTGINFEAQIGLKSPQASASLGVVDEHELAQANVIENFLRVFAAHKALEQRGVVLHSAGLVVNEKAYIFSGRSNAGKTTLTRKAYIKGARVLSDDINLVLPGENCYDAYSVPFTGEFGRALDHAGGKESYPVAGIILLEQSDHLETLPVTPSAAVARLLTGCPFVNTDEHETEALFDSVTRLVSNVPVIRLLSRKDDDVDDIMSAVKQQFNM